MYTYNNVYIPMPFIYLFCFNYFCYSIHAYGIQSLILVFSFVPWCYLVMTLGLSLPLCSHLNDCILCPPVWTAFMHYLKHLLATSWIVLLFFLYQQIALTLFNECPAHSLPLHKKAIPHPKLFIGKCSWLNSFSCLWEQLQTFFFFLLFSFVVLLWPAY